MGDEGLINSWINPLAFLEVDDPWAPEDGHAVSAEDILQYICTPDQDSGRDDLVARYREISTEPVRLFAVPADQRVLDKLVWPLRQAKASYMVGSYLATIALSGMVAEMVALLRWQLADASVGGHRMTKTDEAALFGSTFEKLSQDRRVKVLGALAAASPADVEAFDLVRMTRRRYLHLWSQDHDRLPPDAAACFHAAVGLVVRTIGQDIEDGMLRLQPSFARYLQRQGVYESPEEAAPDVL